MKRCCVGPKGLIAFIVAFHAMHWFKPSQSYLVDLGKTIGGLTTAQVESVLPIMTYSTLPAAVIFGAIFEFWGVGPALLLCSLCDVACTLLVYMCKGGALLPLQISEVAFAGSFTVLFLVTATLSAVLPPALHHKALSYNRAGVLVAIFSSSLVGQAIESAGKLPLALDISSGTSIAALLILGGMACVPAGELRRWVRCGAGRRRDGGEAESEARTDAAAPLLGDAAETSSSEVSRTGAPKQAAVGVGGGAVELSSPLPVVTPRRGASFLSPASMPPLSAASSMPPLSAVTSDDDPMSVSFEASAAAAVAVTLFPPPPPSRCKAWLLRTVPLLAHPGLAFPSPLWFLYFTLSLMFSVHTLVLIYLQPALDDIWPGESYNGAVMAAAFGFSAFTAALPAAAPLRRITTAWLLYTTLVCTAVLGGLLFGFSLCVGAGGSKTDDDANRTAFIVAAALLVAYHGVTEFLLVSINAYVSTRVKRLLTDGEESNDTALAATAEKAAPTTKTTVGPVFTLVALTTQLCQIGIQAGVATGGSQVRFLVLSCCVWGVTAGGFLAFPLIRHEFRDWSK